MEKNYTIRIDLKKFRNAGLATIAGKIGKKKCVIIPVDDNPEIFIGEKGLWLSLAAIGMKEPGKYGDTHIVKGNIPKEIREAMSEEERKSQPILGQMQPMERKEMSAPEASVEDEDDLPF